MAGNDKGAAAAVPARFGPDCLLRDTVGGEKWTKIVSDNGITVAGKLVAIHYDGTATIALGGFHHVRGEVIARGVIQQFGPLSAKERAERRLPPIPPHQRKSINGETLKPGAAW